jgi:hypothetical protein
MLTERRTHLEISIKIKLEIGKVLKERDLKIKKLFSNDKKFGRNKI